ncbi:hypothetical protein BJ912DRAFT_970997, partial [Pholiota molesta]
MSLQNVTIDDGANSTVAQILYSPPLCNGSGWTVSEGQGVGDSYRFCTSSNKSVTPSASLSFTGVGVYYMSPYFPGDFMGFTLDGVETQGVNLSAPAGTSSNTSASAVIWSAVNLNNTQHLLELRPNNGSRTLNVDAFIITQLASNATAPSGNVTQAPPTGTNPLLGLPNLLPPVQSARTTRLSMGLGITFGALSFLIFLGISIFLGRRTRGMRQNFYGSKPIPSIHPVDEDPDVIDTRAAYTQDSYQQSSPVSPRTDEVAVPMRMLPSVAHGSFTTQPDFEGGYALSEGDAHGRASPAFSNTLLISKRASSSSQGHGGEYDAAASPSGAAAVKHHPPIIKFEPVRMSTAPAGPRVRAGSSSAQSHGHGMGDGGASVSRNTTFASRLEPARARGPESNAPSAFSASAFGGASARDHESGAVSRSATMFNSTRFEPVRKGH